MGYAQPPYSAYVIWAELRGWWRLFWDCWSPFLPDSREHMAHLGHVTSKTISPASLPPLKTCNGWTQGKKTNHSYVCALRQTALVYPCSSKGNETAYNQQGKEQVEGPVGAGVGGHSHYPRASLLKVTLSLPSLPSHVWQHAPWLVICALCPCLLWHPMLCLLNDLLFHLLLSLPRGAVFFLVYD